MNPGNEYIVWPKGRKVAMRRVCEAARAVVNTPPLDKSFEESVAMYKELAESVRALDELEEFFDMEGANVTEESSR